MKKIAQLKFYSDMMWIFVKSLATQYISSAEFVLIYDKPKQNIGKAEIR